MAYDPRPSDSLTAVLVELEARVLQVEQRWDGMVIVHQPAPPDDTDVLWWDSDTGHTYTWVPDEGQWVQIAPGGGSGGTGGCAVIAHQSTPPADTSVLWWDCDTGFTYTHVPGDGWVQIAPGSGGSGQATDTGWTHVQALPAATWSISHNLGRLALVQVFSDSGELVCADVIHADSQTTVIQFAAPFSGTARLA